MLVLVLVQEWLLISEAEQKQLIEVFFEQKDEPTKGARGSTESSVDLTPWEEAELEAMEKMFLSTSESQVSAFSSHPLSLLY